MNKLHKIKLALAILGVTATLTGWSAPATTLAALPEGWVLIPSKGQSFHLGQ
jgi:hypothetical protein